MDAFFPTRFSTPLSFSLLFPSALSPSPSIRAFRFNFEISLKPLLCFIKMLSLMLTTSDSKKGRNSFHFVSMAFSFFS